MTSKEALQHIINLVSDDTYYRDRLEEEFEILQRDLEVLEILKYLIPSIERSFNLKQFNESGMLGTIIKDYFINNDITGKVEEWLNDARETNTK